MFYQASSQIARLLCPPYKIWWEGIILYSLQILCPMLVKSSAGWPWSARRLSEIGLSLTHKAKELIILYTSPCNNTRANTQFSHSLWANISINPYTQWPFSNKHSSRREDFGNHKHCRPVFSQSATVWHFWHETRHSLLVTGYIDLSG